MWAWRVTGRLGIVRGGSDEPARAADWVELFLTRSPGEAEGLITGPTWRPVRIGSRDGVLYPLDDGDG